ncbi:MAG: amidohydrolase family protein [Acidobacteria bacterium]|nr:amidohydrolase family protein [Acidobacteriota bacterium]
MKKRIVIVLLVAALFPVLSLAQQIPSLIAKFGYPDLLLVNGKIVSMDDRSIIPDTPGHIYQAMAIKGKKIMALGTNQEIRALAGSDTRIEDMGGRTVIPGLIQTHYHLFGPAAAKFGPSQGLVDPSVKLTVDSETTSEATAKKTRETIVNAIQVQKIPKGQWITVRLNDAKVNKPATSRSWLYRGEINRRQFDSTIQDHPIMISAGNAAIFNAAAIAEMKKVFHDWEESTDLENRSDAAKDGYGGVPEIQGLTFALWWKDKPIASLAESLRLHGVDLQKLGITTVSTRILYPSVIAAYNKLNRDGQMPHRLAYYVESQRGEFMSLESTRQFYKASGAPWTNHANGGEMLWCGGMAQEVWDSSQLEVCLSPDVPATPELKARERCPAPGTRPWEAVKAGILTGWRPVQVHGTSSGGVRLYIKMIEEAMKEGNLSVDYIRSLRTTVEHNFVLGTPPDVIEGIKKYGILLNVNTGYLKDAAPLIMDYGEQVRPFAMPVKTWLNDGIRVTFEAAGTDFWTPIYTLVTREITNPRTAAKEKLLPEQAIDRVTALKMATTWASEYMMAEDTVGTLEPGKFADFVVLKEDFFTVPVPEILNMEVVLTSLSGQIVWDNRSGKEKPPGRGAAE